LRLKTWFDYTSYVSILKKKPDALDEPEESEIQSPEVFIIEDY
jgi:hypothetical protein